ncbi:hemolysin III-like integral membrane [Tubulinosema ratisbonensis]|uniref:Hemolysin III-like integral membrane n=1 Tax=Tubulinosema ratisbonensis TaxID=291195 RepID=A0A437ALK0_9MICR|nr:hemolysin III-like integral membrane [Tubulinosema ratisbonensis]
MEEVKPKLRGLIHYIAFIFSSVLFAMYIPLWIIGKFDLGVAIYIFVQIILFGVSSTYHRTNWKSEKTRRFFQRLDHASIFLLISGTQTAVAMLLHPLLSKIKQFLITTWIISSLGIAKTMILNHIYETADIVMYIIHGSSVVPFLDIFIKRIEWAEFVMFMLGGAFYIIGAILFRIRKPDPSPLVFGYHEIWHVFTVLANLCFFISISKLYIQKCFLNKEI